MTKRGHCGMRAEEVEARRVLVLALMEKGWTVREIARRAGAHDRNVRSILKRHGWSAPNGKAGGVWVRKARSE